MILTDAERVKFQEWLLEEANTCDVLVTQMEKIKVPHQFIVMQRTRANAARLVFTLLEKGEEG